MVSQADPNITNAAEQFLHQFGHPIMLLICLFLLWLGIKKQYEPLGEGYISKSYRFIIIITRTIIRFFSLLSSIL